MTIFLEAPRHRPGGPDGQGWNRLSLNAHMGAPADQCALRPRAGQTLREAWNTPIARWGGFGCCDNGGNCGTCPRLEALEDDPKWLPANTDRVLVRLKEWEGDFGWLGAPPPVPYVVDDPAAGWASPRYRWTWESLVRLRGWSLGRLHCDEHGEGFWLVKVDPGQLYGIEKSD